MINARIRRSESGPGCRCIRRETLSRDGRDPARGRLGSALAGQPDQTVTPPGLQATRWRHHWQRATGPLAAARTATPRRRRRTRREGWLTTQRKRLAPLRLDHANLKDAGTGIGMSRQRGNSSSHRSIPHWQSDCSSRPLVGHYETKTCTAFPHKLQAREQS
jgi:hypothetical protein